MRRIRVRLLSVLSLLLVSLLLCAYEAGDPRVFDGADLLTAEEESRVEQALEEAIPQEKLDMVVVTTYDTEGYSTSSYAEYFYYDAGHRFGFGGSDRGILLLIDMQHREVYVYYSEDAERLFDDDEVENIIDRFYGALRAERYEDCCLDFIEAVKDYDSVISAGGILIRIGIAAAVAAVVVWLMARRQKSRMTANGDTYARAGAFQIRYRRDYFTHRTTQTRKIESSSGGRSGGGGGSHSRGGGGGRSF